MSVSRYYSSSDSFHTARSKFKFSNESLVMVKSNQGQLREPNNYLSPATIRLEQGHRRVESNPFDVLYVPESSPLKSRTAESSARQSPVHSNAYREIERNIIEGKKRSPPRMGQKPLASPTSIRVSSSVPPRSQGKAYESHPVVTIIDDNKIKRSGSVISTSATLRNKNSIRRRNRMVMRKELELHEKTESSKAKTNKKKLISFPVKRNTSLKRYPSYSSLRQTVPSFKNSEELHHFFESCSAANLVKEMMPQKMKLYKFDRLPLVNPRLVANIKTIEISNGEDFNIIENSGNFNISAPIKETFRKESGNPYHYMYNSEKSLCLFDSTYTKYKNAVFANKLMIPPKFYEFFSRDEFKNLLSEDQVDKLNEKLLFEILLRRTLAAKIGYRLKQNRKSAFQFSSSDNSSDSSHSSKRVLKKEEHEPRFSDSESSSYDDVATDDLIKLNRSFFAELLPSPQISYQSDIFGSIHSYNLNDNVTELENDTVDSLKNSKCKNEANFKKRMSTSDSGGDNTVVEIGKQDSKKIFENTLDKIYKSKSAPIDFETLPHTSDAYRLEPFQRSCEILSISDTSSVDLVDSFEFSNSTATHSRNEESSTSTKFSRKTKSTSSTNSIKQDLDDVSSELSYFLKEAADSNKIENQLIKNYSKSSERLCTGPTFSGERLTSGQGNHISIKGSSLSQTIEKQMHSYDIQSMSASISIIETSTTGYTSAASQGNKKQKNLNRIEEETSSTSTENILIDGGNLSPKRSRNFVIGRQYSNSTRSEMSNIQIDLTYSNTITSNPLHASIHTVVS